MKVSYLEDWEREASNTPLRRAFVDWVVAWMRLNQDKTTRILQYHYGRSSWVRGERFGYFPNAFL